MEEEIRDTKLFKIFRRNVTIIFVIVLAIVVYTNVFYHAPKTEAVVYNAPIPVTAQVPNNDSSDSIVFYEGGGFAIRIDTAYKYRELLKYYFNIGLPWEDAVNIPLKISGTSNGKYKKAFKVKWHTGTKKIDRAVIDTLKPKVFYGIAGIKQSEPRDTLKRYYFHRYLFFIKKMNETTGRKSARFEDSANLYYKKLYKK